MPRALYGPEMRVPVWLLALIVLGLPAASACADEAEPRFEPEVRGDRLDGALAPGASLGPITFAALDGASITVPDPDGRYVVLELIRSADW